MRFEAVFFDLFGTLVDEATDYRAVDATFAEVAERFRLADRPRDLSGEYALIVMELMAAEPADDQPAPVVSYEGVARGVFEGMMAARGYVVTDDDIDWFWAAHGEKQQENVTFFADAAEAVRVAAQRAPHVGVITDSDPYVAQLLLPAFAESARIASVTTGQEAGAFKPHRPLFHLAAKKAGASPQRCVMVGDSWERDVEGARAAGMRGILLDRHRARTVDAEWTISSLKELPAVLDRI